MDVRGIGARAGTAHAGDADRPRSRPSSPARESRPCCGTSSTVRGRRTRPVAPASRPFAPRPISSAFKESCARRSSRIIGGLPTERTPLNARVTGTLARDGYRIEKLIFESLPGLHVTASLYLPDGPLGRKPAVLVACGHAPTGKAYPAYQEIAGRLATRGYVVLVLGPGRAGRAQPVLGPGERAEPLQPRLRGARGPRQPGHPRGREPRPLDGLGRDARGRLPAEPPRGGPRAHRGHGHERRRVPVRPGSARWTSGSASWLRPAS